jgi:hypothetical protein
MVKTYAYLWFSIWQKTCFQKPKPPNPPKPGRRGQAPRRHGHSEVTDDGGLEKSAVEVFTGFQQR